MAALPPRLSEDWLRDFCSLLSVTEAPPHFAFWSGVFAISAALGRKVSLSMRAFEWVPNFYIVLVAPPGVATKSTTIGFAERMLMEAEACHFGPPSVTWQALIDEFEAAQTEHSAAIACCISELGTFFDPRDPKMIDVLTDLWDATAREWQHRTRSRGGAKIVNPSITMIAATTPAWIRANLSPQMMEGGLASRTIWALAEKKSKLVPYPHLVDPSDEWEKKRLRLVEDLITISKLRGEFKMTERAIAFGVAWYERHWNTRPPAPLAGYWARKQAHLHKLAMILGVSRRNDLVVDEREMEEAAKILDSMEPDITRVIAMVETTEAGRRIAKIVEAVTSSPGIDHKQLYALFSNEMTASEFAEVLASAIKSGQVVMRQGGGAPRFYPPSP